MVERSCVKASYKPALPNMPWFAGFRKLHLHRKYAFQKVEIISGTSGIVIPLVRQAKLGASGRVQVPVGQGLSSHPYRVLRRFWRQNW